MPTGSDGSVAGRIGCSPKDYNRVRGAISAGTELTTW